MYVVPDKLPPLPQVSLTKAVYPVSGITVNAVVAPDSTMLDGGLIAPFTPADAVTV